MNVAKSTKRDLYYSNDHEWIDFQGAVAYIGICAFKMKGIRNIEQIVLKEGSTVKHRGELVAVIHCEEYRIDVHMPVTGSIISTNESLFNQERHLLLEEPEDAGWIALIVPVIPFDRTDLLSIEQYKQSIKRIF